MVQCELDQLYEKSQYIKNVELTRMVHWVQEKLEESLQEYKKVT
jgi:hypothetical protein